MKDKGNILNGEDLYDFQIALSSRTAIFPIIDELMFK
jgi:hypothetical protein